tara:strand:+ start:624 stop:875 length:252 start_codon:yes stop_codon:yes gene_type:complete
MDINFEDWLKGTYEHCIDPTLDIYIDDDIRCVICGDYNKCDCEKVWSKKSYCCEADIDANKICTECKEHCISAWEYDNNLINK